MRYLLSAPGFLLEPFYLLDMDFQLFNAFKERHIAISINECEKWLMEKFKKMKKTFELSQECFIKQQKC